MKLSKGLGPVVDSKRQFPISLVRPET